MERLIVEIPPESIVLKRAFCPRGHSLMADSVLLGDMPTVHLLAKQGTTLEHIYLDARYGNYDVLGGGQFAVGSLVTLHCPECDVSLELEGEECLHCSAPMFSFQLPHKGLAQACSRVGCHFHRLRLQDPGARLAALFSGDE